MSPAAVFDRLMRDLGVRPSGRGTQEWMCTFSGVQYFPGAPRVEDVRIVDIAHHLSRLCRFTGAIRPEHYSVAEHSVHVSYVVPEAHALAGLLHDSPEFAICDLNRPTKVQTPDYQRLEALNWAVIAEKFGLPLVLPPCVHEADMRVLMAEMAALMPPMPAKHDYEHVVPAPVRILALGPNAAEKLFLDRFYELTRGLGRPVVPQTPRVLPGAAHAGVPA